MFHFIINPTAKSNLGVAIWNTIEEYLESIDFKYEKHFTHQKGDATSLAKELSGDTDEPKTIVVLGGDGTLGEVVNGLSNFQNITLSYIPIGSGNDFARGMGILADYLDRLKYIISTDKYQYIDYATIHIGSESRRFIVSSGIGFDASVCHEVNTSKVKKFFNKLHMSNFSYTFIALMQLFRIPYMNVHIKTDEGKVYNFKKLLLFSIHVQRFEGGGYMFCPMANPGDGYLDICIANKVSKLRALTIIPGIKFGKHVNKKGIHFLKGKEFQVKLDTSCFAHADGEADFDTTKHKVITYKISDEQIRFI